MRDISRVAEEAGRGEGGRGEHLRLSCSFFITSFCLEACLERWNMLGSQLLARSMLIAGAVPPRSWGSCAQSRGFPGVLPSCWFSRRRYMYDGRPWRQQRKR